MWGLAGEHERRSHTTDDDDAARRHPIFTRSTNASKRLVVALITMLQGVVLIVMLALVWDPWTRNTSASAIKQTVELTPYAPAAATAFCGQVSCGTDVGDTRPAILREIGSVADVEAWLMQVLSPLFQEGYIATLNMIYTVTIVLERAGAFEKAAPALNDFVTNISSDEREKTTRLLFRHDAADSNLTAVIDDWKRSGWISDATTKAVVKIKTFNGVSLVWTEVTYRFSQKGGGLRFSSHQWNARQPLTVHKSFLAAKMVLFAFIAASFAAELFSEVFSAYRTRSKSATSTFLSRYLKARGLAVLIIVLKIPLIVGLIMAIASRPLPKGIDDLGEAVAAKVENVPRAFFLEAAETAFVLIAVAVGVLIFACAVYNLGWIHQDLALILQSTIQHAGNLYPVAVALMALVTIYVTCWTFTAGGAVEGLVVAVTNATRQGPIGMLVIGIFESYVIWALLVPTLAAVVVHYYSVVAVDVPGQGGGWLLSSLVPMLERRLCCLTPLPRLLRPTEDKQPLLEREPSEKLATENIKTLSLASSGHLRLQGISIAAIAVFFVASIPTLVGMQKYLNNGSLRSLSRLNWNAYWNQPFQWVPRVAPEPFTQSAMVPIPNRGVPGLTPLLPTEQVGALQTVPHLTPLKDWAINVVVARFLNPNYEPGRSTTPLHNPTFLQLETGSTLQQPADYLEPLWPTVETGGNNPYLMLGSPVLVFNELASAVNGSVSAASTTTSGGSAHLALSLYFSDIAAMAEGVETCYKDMFQLNPHIFSGRVGSLLVAEFSGDDEQVFVVNRIGTTVYESGGVNTDFSVTATLVRRAAGSDGEDYDSIQLVGDEARWWLLSGTVLILLYLGLRVYVVWMTLKQKQRVTYYLDVLLFGFNLLIVLAISEALRSPVRSGWTEQDAPSSSRHPASVGQVPGPVILNPVSGATSLILPSVQRALRLLRELRAAEDRDAFVWVIFTAGTVAIGLRAFLQVAGLPLKPFQTLRRTVVDARLRLVDLALLALLPFALFYSVELILLGWWTFDASFSRSLLRSFFYLFPRRVLDQPSPARKLLQHPKGDIALAVARLGLSSLLGGCLQGTLLAVLLHGRRKHRTEKLQQRRKTAKSKFRLEPRPEIVISVYKQALQYANAGAKALQLRRRLKHHEGHFSRLSDQFFLRFRECATFKKTPTNIEGYVARAVQANNLTRIQQYIADLLVLSAKSHLLQHDLRNIKEKNEEVQKATHGKTQQLRILERQLARLREQLEIVKGNVEFEKADFRQDVITRNVATAHGAVVTASELEQLAAQTENERSARERIVQGRNRAREIEEERGLHGYFDVKPDGVVDTVQIEERKTAVTLPHQVLPGPENALDGEDEEDEDFALARQVMEEAFRPTKVTLESPTTVGAKAKELAEAQTRPKVRTQKQKEKQQQQQRQQDPNRLEAPLTPVERPPERKMDFF